MIDDEGVRCEAAARNLPLLIGALDRFADTQTTRIGLETVEADGITVEVSTVDLVWAHRAGHYETRVVSADQEVFLRYASREAAAAGHAQIVADLRAGRPFDFG